MKLRRWILYRFLAVVCLTPGGALAQPDLFFAQMAVGGGGDGPEIETVITLTNSAAADFQGIFRFRTGEGQIWNPEVGGQPLVNGEFNVSLEPSETTTFVLTGSDLTVGSGMLSGVGDTPDSVEGTLTFLVRSGGNARFLFRSALSFRSLHRSLPQRSLDRDGHFGTEPPVSALSLVPSQAMKAA